MFEMGSKFGVQSRTPLNAKPLLVSGWANLEGSAITRMGFLPKP